MCVNIFIKAKLKNDNNLIIEKILDILNLLIIEDYDGVLYYTVKESTENEV
jgi:hypothetical protein